MPAVIFSEGTKVKALKNTLQFKDLTEITSKEIADYLSARSDGKEPTGFVNQTDSSISFVNGTRTFSIAPAVTSYDYYILGIKYTSSITSNVVIPNTEGLHYIYFDGSTLSSATTFSYSLLCDYALVAIVYWDATNSVQIGLGDERHGMTMDCATHYHLHTSVGTILASGGALNSINVDASGNLDSSAELGNDATVLFDEDLDISHTARLASDNISVYYRSGATGVWRETGTSDTFPITTTGTGRAAWNEFTGGVWQLTEVSNNQYVLSHIFATNDRTRKFIAVAGQSDYTTVGQARIGATTELNSLILSGLPSAEFKPLGTLIFQTSTSYTNTVKSRIRSTDEGDDYVDWRYSNLSPSVSPSSHSGLSNLGADDHTQYLLRNDADQARLQVFKEQQVPVADWITTGLTNASLTSETTNVISGTSSYKLSNAASAGTEVAYSPSVTIQQRSTEKDLVISFPFTYDGTAGYISAFLQTSTDGTTFTDVASSEVELDPSTSGYAYPVGLIGSTVVAARLKLYINTAEAADLIFNDVEFYDRPYVYGNLLDEQTIRLDTQNGYGSTNTCIRRFTNTVTNEGASIISYVDSATDGSSFTALKDCFVYVSYTDNGSTNFYNGISLNSTQLSTTIQNITVTDRLAMDLQTLTTAAAFSAWSGKLSAGDIIRPHTDGNSGTASGAHFTIHAIAETEHIMIPAKSTLTDWESYTPITQGFGTVTNMDAKWRRVGDSIEIQADWTNGTVAASEAQFGLPTVDGSQVVIGSFDSALSAIVGIGQRYVNGGTTKTVLAVDGDSYFNFSTTGSLNPLDPRLGSEVAGSSEKFSFFARVAVSGWTGEATFLVAIPVQKTAYIKDVKTAGTAGGTFTSGAWQTRDLNTVEGDSEIVSLSSNQFTLSAGKYEIEIECPAYIVNRHQCKLVQDPSGTPVDAIIGSSNYAPSDNQIPSIAKGSVTITTSTVFEVQHQCSTTNSADGYGFAANLGLDEIYTQVKITKVK